MSRVAVLKGGRSLERQVSLKSGARVQDALQRLGHQVIAIDVGDDLVVRLTADPPDLAFVDGRGGSSMRLNFSGADEDEIREGVRRIGEIVREQVALYGTLTGVSQPPRRGAARPSADDRPAAQQASDAQPERAPADPELAKILKLPAQRSRAG